MQTTDDVTSDDELEGFSGLDEMKRYIDRVLRESQNLSDADRKQVLRRLYLQFHPDKNLDREKESKEAFQYLQNWIKDGKFMRILMTILKFRLWFREVI